MPRRNGQKTKKHKVAKGKAKRKVYKAPKKVFKAKAKAKIKRPTTTRPRFVRDVPTTAVLPLPSRAEQDPLIVPKSQSTVTQNPYTVILNSNRYSSNSPSDLYLREQLRRHEAEWNADPVNAQAIYDRNEAASANVRAQIEDQNDPNSYISRDRAEQGAVILENNRRAWVEYERQREENERQWRYNHRSDWEKITDWVSDTLDLGSGRVGQVLGTGLGTGIGTAVGGSLGGRIGGQLGGIAGGNLGQMSGYGCYTMNPNCRNIKKNTILYPIRE